MEIRLIIFDLDGTLVDSAMDITDALNFALAPYSFPRLTVSQTISMLGEGLTRLVEKLLGKDSEGLKPAVLERFLGYYSEHLVDYTKPYPHVKETLEALGSFRKAVISNKREELSRRLLEKLGLSSFFDAILGSDSTDQRKPSPKPVLKVLDMLSVDPGAAVIVGDSNFDIEAGKAAGIRTVAVSYGYRDVSLLQNADCIIGSFNELAAALERMDREGSCHGNHP